MRTDPAKVEMAMELVASPVEVSVEVRINAWDVLHRGAGDYVNLVNYPKMRPVGQGMIGDPETEHRIWFCETHGWAAEETFCYFPEFYRRSFKVWKRLGKIRKLRRECKIVPKLIFDVESFE